MEHKEKTPPPTELEKLFNKIPYPLFSTLFSSFVFVYLLGLFFSSGLQIYPIFNNIPEGVDCPECRVLNDTQVTVTERQFRIVYQVISDVPFTKHNAWRLFRLRINGPHFSQEIRAEDNCGIYSLGVKHHAIHFELTQEGECVFELLCLDNVLYQGRGNVQPYERETKDSIFHKNQEVSNICRRNEKFIFFSNSYTFNVSKNSFVPNLHHEKIAFNEYSNETTVINNAFLMKLGNSQISRMSTKDLINKVILTVFVQSHFGQTIIFENNNIDEQFMKIIRKVTEEKAKSGTFLCFRKLTTIPNYKKINSLSENEIEMMRSLATSRNSQRGDKIFITHFEGSETVQKSGDFQYIDDGKLTFDRKVELLSSAKAMIAKDDDNEVLNALFMPKESPLILIVPPITKSYSDSVKRIESTGRKIIYIVGDKKNVESDLDDKELVKECIEDENESNSEKCAQVFRSLHYTYDIKKVEDAIKQM
ncbi:hypothetical protein TRFO_07701 [Tritrichomonas foetus]|uniref:Uncharacterized protein n=1 Tax=Tritrichomonas foetus TaxID=1144522 RepID=A0A1J4JU37_9EUKA|nr:hypothetical protein TRFO_07701 [Tritrichomonas foetus]|eukprot:OHT01028.1 hypothetical protein TRFO_07701 [Tritrichomonas foetus]